MKEQTYRMMQWAAVKTNSFEMIAHPHRRPEDSCKLHWNGAKLSGASSPPTIRGDIDRPPLAVNQSNNKN